MAQGGSEVKKFAVVEFVEEKTVDIVPFTWISEDE